MDFGDCNGIECCQGNGIACGAIVRTGPVPARVVPGPSDTDAIEELPLRLRDGGSMSMVLRLASG